MLADSLFLCVHDSTMGFKVRMGIAVENELAGSDFAQALDAFPRGWQRLVHTFLSENLSWQTHSNGK